MSPWLCRKNGSFHQSSIKWTLLKRARLSWEDNERREKKAHVSPKKSNSVKWVSIITADNQICANMAIAVVVGNKAIRKLTAAGDGNKKGKLGISLVFIFRSTAGNNKSLIFTWSLKQVGGNEGWIFHYVDQTWVNTASLLKGVSVCRWRCHTDIIRSQWMGHFMCCGAREQLALSAKLTQKCPSDTNVHKSMTGWRIYN